MGFPRALLDIDMEPQEGLHHLVAGLEGHTEGPGHGELRIGQERVLELLGTLRFGGILRPVGADGDGLVPQLLQLGMNGAQLTQLLGTVRSPPPR